MVYTISFQSCYACVMDALCVKDTDTGICRVNTGLCRINTGEQGVCRVNTG